MGSVSLSPCAGQFPAWNLPDR